MYLNGWVRVKICLPFGCLLSLSASFVFTEKGFIADFSRRKETPLDKAVSLTTFHIAPPLFPRPVERLIRSGRSTRNDTSTDVIRLKSNYRPPQSSDPFSANQFRSRSASPYYREALSNHKPHLHLPPASSHKQARCVHCG